MRIPKTTKHCQDCNRCVHKFDHHCGYLNNCINSDNYIYFFGSVVMMVFYSIIIIIFLIESLDIIKHKLIINLIYTSIGISSLVLILSVYLGTWHMWFTYKNVSTYSYLKYNTSLAIKKKSLNKEELA